MKKGKAHGTPALMHCPYCRTGLTWGLIRCPNCNARISYGCKVPITGFFLSVVVAFLAASSLIALLATRDTGGNPCISNTILAGIGAFSALLGLGSWLLMLRAARRSVSFSRDRRFDY
ncbi:MAG: hypothetical protein JO015_13670 [Verrucomicrobia bacterium]|nr:hypothetical protein [Verrucomicrobiota bacterium]